MPISELMGSISGKNKIKIFPNSTQEIIIYLMILYGMLLNNIRAKWR